MTRGKVFIITVISALSILASLFLLPKNALAYCDVCNEDLQCTSNADCSLPGYIGTCSRNCNSTYPFKVCCYTPQSTNPTNTPTPKPTDTPAPNCSCSNDGRCVGNVNSCSFAVQYDCDYDRPDLGLCPGTDNAWVYDKCGKTNCGPPGYYCAYVAGCANPTIAPTTAACQENNPGCGATPVPLDCNYNATGCNLCGVGRVKAIYCGPVHCGDVCVSNSLCGNNQWCSGGGGALPVTLQPATTGSPSNLSQRHKGTEKCVINALLSLRVSV